MTLNQLQTYIVGVLQGYFPNKAVLDKLSENTDGTLLFNGQPISGEAIVTDAELQQAIVDTLEELGITEEDIEASVGSVAALQTAIANGANKITITKPLTISNDVTLAPEEPIEIIANGIVDVFTVTEGTLTLGNNIKVESDVSILYATGNGTITIDGADLCSTSTDYTLGYADAKAVINVVSGKIVAEGNSVLTPDADGAEVNISGGVVQTKDQKFSAVYAKNKGTVNVTGGTLINGGTPGTGSYTLIAAKDGIVNMTGGSVDFGVLAHESADAKATISNNAQVYGPLGTNNDATLVITGGVFDTDPSEYVPDTHTVLSDDGVWTVVANV
jgi:hypothetical protein